MTAAAECAYDRVLYESHPFSQTHPDNLSAVATLFGMNPAPAQGCRLLELGCGNGANLVPMALALPGSRFVGIDLARTPIAAAQELAARLELRNITFHQLDIAQVDPSFGEFDYIVAHGLYSWISTAARDKLLAVSKSNLAPHGVAYVSYNTYPGCHLRNMVREMLLYQTRDIDDPELKIKHAYALINLLASSDPKSPALREELFTLQSRHPSALFHDDLAEMNEPVYFHQFMDHAGRHGLQFLAEAEVFAMQDAGFPREVAGTVQLLSKGDRIREQQYLDFLKCCRFRQTLLCHQDIRLENPPDPRRIMRLFLASPAQPLRDLPDLAPDAEEEFRSADGASMKTNLPLAKAAILHLARRWPLVVPFEELLPEARALLGMGTAASADDAATLAALLLKIHASGLVELHAIPSNFTLSVSERPRAFSLARLQAQSGTLLTTLRHTSVELQDELVRQLVVLSDGSRDHAALLRDLQTLTAASDQPNPLEAADLERNLRATAHMALLEA